ncbi:MAG: hypothetical protein Q8O26_19175 [Phreatobacter sp.]|uniref:hypothetical protein n=1 Tax=Phreatobacter sp. TaxID=1966341 RepID=UPI002733F841|nr:hypothetical protein [Phreatobacter sp.]MDP2803998.1 hypothetical protein [Phreatobacter sp.]
MKSIALGALAAVLFFSAPSFAQDLRIRAGEGGISVRSGDDRRDDRRGYRRDRGEDRVIIRERRSEGFGRGRERCRDVTVRTQRPNGTIVIRRERRCN